MPHDFPYQHKPFASESHIRILRLHPALNLRAPIRCNLQETSLQDIKDGRESYEALSYVWGSCHGNQKIFCDGKPLLVTMNCLQALRYLRLKSKTRNLWVDALCIDQRNVQERSHQVALMGDVYRLASKVLIWFGPGNLYFRMHIRKLGAKAWALSAPAMLRDRFNHIYPEQSGLVVEERIEWLKRKLHWLRKLPVPDWASVLPVALIGQLHTSLLVLSSKFYLLAMENAR